MKRSVKEILIRFYKRYSNHFLPSWLVLLFDLGVIFFTFYIALFIRLNFNLKELYLDRETPQALFVSLVYGLAFLGFGSYSGIIRHTGLNDAYRIFQAMGTSFVFLILLSIGIRALNIHISVTNSQAALMIHVLLAYFILMGFRVTVKTAFQKILNTRTGKSQHVIIYGSGNEGILLRNVLINDPIIPYHIVAFADDNPKKAKKMLEGIPVLLPEQVLNQGFIEKSSSGLLIIAIQQMDPEKKANIIDKSIELGLEVKIVPPIDNWINGRLSSTQLREVNIGDLLGREPIALDNANVALEIRNKTVLVTGAAGSIGSEIVRQCIQYEPHLIILLDQAETPLFDLAFEINNSKLLKKFANNAVLQIADVNNKDRLDQIFSTYKPDIVFHAAAYKHVPLMEEFPQEAVQVNVFGTKNVADLSVKHRVRKFVMISTDKAVRPTNVMGATKRIAEIYTQSLSNENTQFITTRFGNVLGSNGSVIPIFRKQIENGGPVTVTHFDIVRYFMTIPEACNLVLQAGSMGHGGELFVFDMGEPVKIYELAKKMIRLSGFQPGKDIQIIETGLRPGEKLFEELLTKDENIIQTPHPKIMLAEVPKRDTKDIEIQLNNLIQASIGGNSLNIIQSIESILPEYKFEKQKSQVEK
ncbi:MAG: polysaccharide biosynthesis protein [Bacteroidales bacterium]